MAGKVFHWTNHAVVGGVIVAGLVALPKLLPWFNTMLARFSWLGPTLTLTGVAVLFLFVGRAIGRLHSGRAAALDKPESLIDLGLPAGGVKRQQNVIGPGETHLIDLGLPAGGVKRRQKVIVLEETQRSFSWDLMEQGSHSLFRQLGDDGWNPDIVLGINQGGAIIAGLVASARSVRAGNFATASVTGPWGHRKLERLGVPTVTDPSNLKVLLIDNSMKTGESLECVKDGLVERGYSADNIRVAVMVLANLRSIPAAGSTVDISAKLFPQNQRTPPVLYAEWLGRLYYLAFVSRLILDPPWESWETKQ